jgi:hypothetical protein
MLNAGKLALAVPSLTLILMLLNVPTLAAVGVPLSRPVLELNAAQAGALAMLNVSVLPSASVALGENTYALPCSTLVLGVPAICGAELPGGGLAGGLVAGGLVAGGLVAGGLLAGGLLAGGLLLAGGVAAAATSSSSPPQAASSEVESARAANSEMR